MSYGYDFSSSRPSPAAIKAAGGAFVSRYLSYQPNLKIATKSELLSYISAGIDVFLNWEYTATHALGGGGAGAADGAEAVRQAQALGYPKGATIYFSIDWDATPEQQLVINSYIHAAALRVHPAGYRMGAYAGYHVIRRLFDAGMIDDGWQAYAWSRFKSGVTVGPQAVLVRLFDGHDYWFDKRASLRQIQNGLFIGGQSVDKDQLVGPYHSWLTSAAKPLPPVPTSGIFLIKEPAYDAVYLFFGNLRHVPNPASLIVVQSALSHLGFPTQVFLIPNGTLSHYGKVV